MKHQKSLTYKGAVMTWECDSNRHMNVMYYINKFEHAGRNFDLDLGLIEVLDSEEVGIVVVEQLVQYKQEVFEDDLLHVYSNLIDIGTKSFTVMHEMYNSRTDKMVSTMRAVLVLFDKNNRVGIAIPEKQRKVLQAKYQLN